MLSVYALTKLPDEAVQVVDFFVEDPRAGGSLSTETRGPGVDGGCAH